MGCQDKGGICEIMTIYDKNNGGSIINRVRYEAVCVCEYDYSPYRYKLRGNTTCYG